MFDRIAALELGTGYVRCLAARIGFRRFEIVSYQEEEVDPDLPREEGIYRALDFITEEVPLKEYRIVMSAPMERTITRHITFPFDAVEQIAEAIPFEAEQQIPFTINDIVFDFQTLNSFEEGKGRVLLAALVKEWLEEHAGRFRERDLELTYLGLEPNALSELYTRYSTVQDENVIILDLGYARTICAFLLNGELSWYRSLPFGYRNLEDVAMRVLDLSRSQARNLFRRLDIDILAPEDRTTEELKPYGITKKKYKDLASRLTDEIEHLEEEFNLTLASFEIERGEHEIDFHRVLASGIMADFRGMAGYLSTLTGLPVSAPPFPPEYRGMAGQHRWSVCFGTLLSYMGPRRGQINFLRGEFTPDLGGTGRRVYYLSGFFLLLAGIVFILNLVLSIWMNEHAAGRYNSLLTQKIEKRFGIDPGRGDPMEKARKLVRSRQKKIGDIEEMVRPGSSMMKTLQGLTSHMEEDSSFQLRNIVINERIIRMDGSVQESTVIDRYKKRLIESGMFETVTSNIKYAGKDTSRFTITIKQKQSDSDKGEGK